ncbi:hypothetical protein PMSD_08885 [Paenibacillus macquariensis subsp. defensor]|nr:hypothetical protein PMSD_08885 [Paenibacillus macquariensis subsp. defensor]
MNKAWKVVTAAVLFSSVAWVGSILNTTASGAGSTTQPGTSDDPVVTKSYVDQQIQKALGGGTTTTPTPVPPTPVPPNPTDNGNSSANALVVVDVKPGETLIANAGTEFIVRNGKAVIYSPDANGVPDLTAGLDIKSGQPVTTNHLLSFPREGRGITVQDGQKYGLVVMARGSYIIQ